MSYQVSPVNCSAVTETVSYHKAVEVIETALKRYCTTPDAPLEQEPVFDLDRLLVAFNGGKDCTLILALIHHATRSLVRCCGRLRLMYIRDDPEETFPEVAEFVEAAKEAYQMESIEVANGDMKSALEQIVRDHPEVRGIFMGTRSTDPNAGWMDYFCQTSSGWPKMDLIAPLLHMSYADVWHIIDALGITYCRLYERGYTSIGSISNTSPNPFLRIDESDDYLHARELADGSKERCGRK